MINLSKAPMERKKTMFTRLEFIVPAYFLCALIDGDFSGLNDEEEEQINNFIDATLQKYGNAFFHPDFTTEPYFSYRNDINNLGGDVARIFLMIQHK